MFAMSTSRSSHNYDENGHVYGVRYRPIGQPISPVRWKANVARVTALFVAAMSASAIAASLPPSPSGSCPFGYYSNGSFCTSGDDEQRNAEDQDDDSQPSEDAQDTMPKPPHHSEERDR
jgi:hypothetical protein